MRNRAKCKLCQTVIESFHLYDYVSCKCGDIAISGGMQKFEVFYKNIGSFMRIDDEGNEILVKEDDKKNESLPEETPDKLSKKEQLDMLEAMIKNIENLPQNAMSLPINHYDFYSFMLVVLSILRED